MDHEVRKFSFLLIPGFSLVALSCAIDVLRAANIEAGQTIFEWSLIGGSSEKTNVNGMRSVASSSGIELATTRLPDPDFFDAIAVCGGERSHTFNDTQIVGWLKQAARSGAHIGSLSDGAFIVAGAGLYADTRSTIHWKCQSAYRERFPKLDIRVSILEIDGNRFSCAGGTASLDLMLHFVSRVLGPEAIGRIADNYFHDVIRGNDQVQHVSSAFRFAGRSKVISDALIIMEADLENPVSVAEIAERLSISHRQLDRVFRRHLHASPAQHYREMRLSRASGLLKQTELSISEIAEGCGFHGASHLSKFFKVKFGETPLQHRQSDWRARQ